MKIILALLFSCIFMANTAAADADLTQQLLKEIQALRKRVEKLEKEKEERQQAEQRGSRGDELDEMLADTGEKSSTLAGDIISNTTIGGYISTEFEDFENRSSTFDQHRLVLSVASQVHERIKVFSEVELEHGPTFGAEGEASGDISIADPDGDGVVDASLDTESGKSGELEVEQAWLQYDFNDNLGLRAGVVLMPFGRFNLHHDDDSNYLTDRPLAARRVVPSTWSEAGIGLVGNVEVGESSSIGGEVYIVNGLDDGFSSGSGGLRGARGSRGSDSNDNKAVVGRLTFSPDLGHEVGVSGYYGDYDDSGNAISGVGADWLFTFGDLCLVGEYSIFNLDDGMNSSGDRAPNNISGVYAELNYDFWFDALNKSFLGDSFEDPKLTASFRYNYAEVDRRGGAAMLDEDSYVVGLAYRPIDSFVLKSEYQFNHGDLERGDSDGFMTSLALGF